MNKLLLSLLLLLAACGKTRNHHYTTVYDNSQMEQQVEDMSDQILELDTRLEMLELAARNNVQIYGFIDPCGPSTTFDEILLDTNYGVVAYYKNLGLVVLEDGAYATTDNQKCNFFIRDGAYSVD